MTYLGGHGVQIYEQLRLENCAPNAFRIDATNEVGANGLPIEIHARDYEMIAPDPNLPLNWAGTEDANSRSDPMLMLVMHDAFGTDQDAVVLPATQSPSLPGVPRGWCSTRGDGDRPAGAALRRARRDVGRERRRAVSRRIIR